MCGVPAVEPVHKIHRSFRNGERKDLPWVASGGVKAQLNSANGELQLTVITRCGPVSGPATITGNRLAVSNIAIGAMGCIDEVGEQKTWVLKFLTRPIEQTFS